MYNHDMKSINIRISPEAARAVKTLREQGVNVSDFVRMQLLNEAAREGDTGRN